MSGSPAVADLARRELLRDSGALFLGFLLVVTTLDVITWALGQFDWGDVLVLLALAVSAALTWRKKVPPVALPWLWSALAALNVAVISHQIADRETAMQIGYIIVVLAIFPPLALLWRPTIVTGILSLAIVAVTAFTTYGHHGHEMWGELEPYDAVLQCAVAFAGGCVVLFFRRRSLMATVDTTSRLERRATTDRLTGVLNREGIEELGSALIDEAHALGRAAFVLFIDINGLKAVNDAKGHDAGDDVIRLVVAASRKVVREGDLLGRWGGDEFVIIGSGSLPDPDIVGARLNEELVRMGGADLWIEGVSVGGASGLGIYAALLAEADSDMYRRRSRSRGGATPPE